MSVNKLFPLLTLLLATLMTLALASCGGGGSGSSSSGDGTLSLSLTDSTTRDYRAVYVTIDRVDVHRADGNWEVVANPQATYNLLELVNGATAVLGEDRLPSGDYTQMRLIIGDTPDTTLNMDDNNHDHANYLIMADNSINELKIPSGPQTGIKLVSGFTINQNQTTELLLDFDAMRSVVKAGKSGKYLLKPTIKVLDRHTEATVQGTVASTEGENISGAFVSAQSGDPLQIQAGTVTDDDGEYKLFLEPGSFTLVVAADGYEPACQPLLLLSRENREKIIFLTDAATTFDLTGTVTVAQPGANERVTVKFYQTIDCDENTTASVVVRELNLDADADGVDYQLNLPAGNYDVVATHFATVDEEEVVQSTNQFSINLSDDLPEMDINF
ncbi:MAG: DUF4382 domain-containing protein [Pelovirga sp.]